MKGRRERLDYYVIRQQNGGATIAARLSPNAELAALQRDVERIARGLAVHRPAADGQAGAGAAACA